MKSYALMKSIRIKSLVDDFTKFEIYELKTNIEKTSHKVKGAHDYMGRCLYPDHVEETPSLVVSPGRGTWFCFGCGRKGNIMDYSYKTKAILGESDDRSVEYPEEECE